MHQHIFNSYCLCGEAEEFDQDSIEIRNNFTFCLQFSVCRSETLDLALQFPIFRLYGKKDSKIW